MIGKKKENSISINQYKNKRELNIGIFIFTLIFIYLLAAVFMYMTSKHVTSYEIREGSILRDTSYAGLIFREEELANAEATGYISYFQGGQSKVKTGASVCAVSGRKLEQPESEELEDTELSEEEQAAITLRAQSFNENFDPQRFSLVYSMKTEVENMLRNVSDQTRTAQLDAIIAESGQAVSIFSAPRDGILALTYDGKESLTKENFKEDDFDRTNYASIKMEDNTEVKTGEPAYRLVTGEKWGVLIQLTDEMAKELSETTSVRVKIDQDSESMWADFSVIRKSGKFYGCLEFNDSMVRYLDRRYVTVELILEDQSGLKIPKSAVVQKSCYAVSQDYLTTGGNSSDTGVMIQAGDSAKFISVDLYNITEKGTAYISHEELKPGTILVMPESSETVTLTDMEPLDGVYNINKGYAVFYPIEILAESDDYYIIREGSVYGPSNYDHIAQNGTDVKEEEVVF